MQVFAESVASATSVSKRPGRSSWTPWPPAMTMTSAGCS